MPESVVIIQHEQGSVAHIRYADRFKDKDIACRSKFVLYRILEKLFDEVEHE